MAGLTPLGTSVTISGATYSDVLDVNYSGASVELIDVTDLSDTTRSKIAGVADLGSVSVKANFSASEYDALETVAEARTAVACTVTFSDTSTWAGNAIVDMPAFSIAGGSGVTTSITLQQTAAWDFTAA